MRIEQNQKIRKAFALTSLALTALALTSMDTVSAVEKPIPGADGKQEDKPAAKTAPTELRTIPFEDLTPDGLLKNRAELAFRHLQEPYFQWDNVSRVNFEAFPGDALGRTINGLTLLSQALNQPEPASLKEIMRRIPAVATAGRISQENADSVVVMTNPFDTTVTTTIAKTDIKSRDLSKLSLMPPGLLNTFTEDEILDLLAYLESMGDPQHPNFSK